MSQYYKSVTRRQTLAGFGGVSAFALLPGCTTAALSPSPDTNAPTDADALLDRIAWNLLEHSPGSATSYGLDTGDKAYLRGQLGGSSPAANDALAGTLRADLQAARSLPRDGLTADQITSLEVVESAYSTALEGMALPYGDVPVGGWRNTPYVVAQNVGAYIDMPRFMSATHPLKDASDVEAYLSRLIQIADVLEGERVRMQNARQFGVIPPDFILDKAIAQMELALTGAMGGGALLDPLLVSDLPEATLASRQAKQIITQMIAPALEAQLAELLTARRMSTSKAGIWAQPQGDEWYSWVLKAATTTSMSADEIHAVGMEELRSIQTEMDTLLAGLGYASGTVGERMTALAQDPRYKFAEGDLGRAQIMEFIEERVDWIKAQMPRAFNTLVDPNMEIRRLPPAEEPGAPNAYGGAGSKDGSIPGRMWINLRTTDLHTRYGLPSLIYHETIPGHVWEGEYSNRLPLIRTLLGFGAFSEGWALYAETMAGELGAYDGDAAGRLGYLQKMLWRAARLVTDTGLHHKRWSREKAIQFFLDEVALPQIQSVSEVERYCSWPGQACSYMIGQQEILRQRSRAQTALGESYDFKAFNDAVILGGNVPLDVLAKIVDRYIANAV